MKSLIIASVLVGLSGCVVAAIPPQYDNVLVAQGPAAVYIWDGREQRFYYDEYNRRYYMPHGWNQRGPNVIVPPPNVIYLWDSRENRFYYEHRHRRHYMPNGWKHQHDHHFEHMDRRRGDNGNWHRHDQGPRDHRYDRDERDHRR